MIDIYLLFAGFGLFQFERLFTLLLLLLKPFKIHKYTVRYDGESYGNMLNILENSCCFTEITVLRSKKIPSGFFFNRQCVGYIYLSGQYSMNEFDITILTTKKYYEYITLEKRVDIGIVDNEHIDIFKKTEAIRFFQRYGTYTNLFYSSVLLNLNHISPLPSQQIIIDSILASFRKKSKITAFIEGVPGSGKSFIGFLLAKEMGASFCHSFNPTDPGDVFSSLISRIRNSECMINDTPIVVVIEEVDIMIQNIHTKSVCLHSKIPTSVKDKSSWSTFLDDMFLYQNIIVILTSNKPKQEIDALDTAYLRQGRVDEFYRMENNKTDL